MKKRKPKNRHTFLVLGLGNPGHKYNETRHNAGFHVVDSLADRLDLNFRKPFFCRYKIARSALTSAELILVKPLTYMNRSGDVLPGLFKAYLPDGGELVVICDNMDLKAGEIRVKSGGSSAGHNGIKSVLEAAGSEDFLRIYVGVGRPDPGAGVIDHVLSPPGPGEAELISRGEERAARAVLDLLEKPLSLVMNEYNRKLT